MLGDPAPGAMRLLIMRFLTILALLISAASFATTTYIETDWNWRPVVMPLPGPGLQVETVFDIVTSGEFELEADVPALPRSVAPGDEGPVSVIYNST